MSRRGRFGRRSRSTGNLTALVAQLMREQQAAKDRVMFDAYQNGGKVDGQPVDDKRMRAYIAGRRDGFAKDDPLYDEWNNRLIQLDFKIGEEKITLAFQQGKASAGAVANYYRQQLNKIPKDSEFYRDVAGRAAQWAKAASSAARGGARRRASAALDGKQNAVARTWNDFTTLEGIVTEAAKRAGIIFGNQTLTDAPAQAIQGLFAAGIALPNGKTLTFAQWQQANVSAYKAFDTQIAINKQLNRGTKELTEGKEKFLNQNLVRLNTVDDRAKYEAARDIWMQAVKDAQNDPRAILDASAKYAKLLGDIRSIAEKDTGLVKNDPEFIGGLLNEINALQGKFSGPTVADLQSTSTEAVADGDGSGTAESIVQVINDAQLLDSGKAYYGQDAFGGGFKVVPYAPGAALDPFGRNGLDQSFQPALINVNGKPTQVMLKGQAIKASGLEDANGEPVTAVNGIPVENLSASQVAGLLQSGAYKPTEGEAQTVGYVFQQAGKTTYGVVQPDGSLKFSTTNPFIGAFGQGQDGFTLFTSSTYSPNSDTVTAAPPAINTGITGEGGLLIDPTVSPSDLRNFASNAQDQNLATALLDIADQRTKEATAEQQYQQRAQGKVPSAPSFTQDVASVVRNALGVATKAILDVSGNPPPLVRDQTGGQAAAIPPIKAPTLGGPTPYVPQISPTPPGGLAGPSPVSPGTAAGSAMAAATNAAITAAKQAASGGKTVGTATNSAIEDYIAKHKDDGVAPPLKSTFNKPL